ncbi:MAG: Zn-ribbon domain-containing OB-fold protein [Desulfatiglandales bacterium]
MAQQKKEIDDRFKKFGTVSFTAITKVNEFVGFLEKGVLAGTICKDCGIKFFPPRADCYKCLGSNMEWFPIQGTGRLVTYSRLQYAPSGFEKEVPYSIALLDFGDFKVFGRLSPDLREEEIQLGMEMRPKVVSTPDGQLTYVFEKA